MNPDQHTVAVIDASTDTRIAEIPVSSGPRTLAIAGDGRVWVTGKEASEISVIDPGTLAVVDTFTFHPGSAPYGIVFDPSASVALVAFEESGEVKRLDGTTGAELTSQSVGRDVRHLAVSGDGATLYLPRFVTPPLPW